MRVLSLWLSGHTSVCRWGWWIIPGWHIRCTWASGIMVYAAVKEYWFDARYEKNPPQTFWMNTQDFIGYVAGAWLAVWWTA